MAGSSSLFFGSSIRLDSRLQFLPRTKRHHAPRADGNLLPGLGISSRPLVLVAQIEVAKAGKFDLLAVGKCVPHLLEEKVHEFTRLAFVEAQLIEQRLSHLRFRQSHAFILEILRPALHSGRHESRLTNGPRPRPRGCENCPEISSPKRRFFYLFLCRDPETRRRPGCREVSSTQRRLHVHVAVLKKLSHRPRLPDRDARAGTGRSLQNAAFSPPAPEGSRLRTASVHM